ncbi:MAG: hypothetical protein HZA16_04885 [Nitrospirae bacterium]|nr:hypothetical protein [Nitrospirota bacterium]
MAYRALRDLGLPFDLIRSEDINNGCLDKYKLLFVPGGWASNKEKSLGDKGTEAIREFVRNGGNYLGLCGGAGLATLEGIGLLNIRRKPTRQRVPSFSGRIFLNVKGHPMWEGNLELRVKSQELREETGILNSSFFTLNSEVVFHAWWPSQFLIEDGGIDVLATYGEALADSFSSDLNTGDIGANGDWAGLEKIYGINLDPGRLKDEPAVVEGRYGKGRVVLSLVHFDTPDDVAGQRVLKNVWEYLNCGEVKGQGAKGKGQEEEYSKFKIQNSTDSSPVTRHPLLIDELESAVDDLISFGERNFLWFRRNSILLQWRRGVRGLEYNTLYIMIREIKKAISNQQSAISIPNILTELRDIETALAPFIDKAKKLLILERHALQKGHITYERCEDPEIQEIRAELFGRSKSHGGRFKDLLDRIDDLLFVLIK